MKLSWSHKLFLRINEQVGKRPWLDKTMVFCAKWLIYGLFGWVVCVLVLLWFNFGQIVYPLIGSFFVGLLLLLTVNWTIGAIWPHRRPQIELPNIKILVHTLGTWKSFPSDHTAASFYIAFFFLLPFVIHANISSLLYFTPQLLLPATLIAMGRVYVGVHYPRDIVGGVFVAFIFAFLATIFVAPLIRQVVFSLI